jgi:hypothetical protein
MFRNACPPHLILRFFESKQVFRMKGDPATVTPSSRTDQAATRKRKPGEGNGKWAGRSMYMRPEISPKM